MPYEPFHHDIKPNHMTESHSPKKLKGAHLCVTKARFNHAAKTIRYTEYGFPLGTAQWR